MVTEAFDIYDKIPWKDELMRIDNFFMRLSAQPDSIGYFRLYIDEKETSKDAKEHIARIMKHIKFRNYDADEIVFSIEKSDKHRTQIYMRPKELKIPDCADCEIIKGSDVK